MVHTFLEVYMELGSSFLFLQEQIKDIIIISLIKIDSLINYEAGAEHHTQIIAAAGELARRSSLAQPRDLANVMMITGFFSCLLLQDLVQSCLRGGGGGYWRTCAAKDDSRGLCGLVCPSRNE